MSPQSNAPSVKQPPTDRPSTDDIWDWLEHVMDPEIPVISVVDLGVVRHILWQEDGLEVVITPTYSGCPAMSVMATDITAELNRRGVARVSVTRQIAPAWTTDWMSEKGRAALENYGIAPPQTTGGPKTCPRCQSLNLELVSQFGSTPCKALWRCCECCEPFDYFKCL